MRRGPTRRWVEGRNVLGTLDRLDSGESLMASTGQVAIDGRVTERTDGAGGFRLLSPMTAVAVVAVTVLVLAVDVPLELAIGTLSPGWGIGVVFAAPYAIVGLVVARRQPRNPLGWLMLMIGLLTSLYSVASDYALFVYRFGHAGSPLGPVAVFLDDGVAGLLLLPLVIMLFPDGELGPRWRWAVRGYIALLALYLAGTWSVAVVALGQRFPVDSGGTVVGASDPSGFAAWTAALQPIFLLGVVTFCVAAIARQALNYRAASGARRQQAKWFVAGVAASMVCLLVLASGALTNSTSNIIWFPIIAGLAALPASIGVAILKYRLYDIDRLISRTVAYAVLTALLIGTFVGLVALTTDVLSFSSPVGVAASTLAAATLFNPLRMRVQRIVDQRFNRARYDADETVAAFVARLRDAVEIDAIRADLLDAVNHAVQPSHASVWISPRMRD